MVEAAYLRTSTSHESSLEAALEAENSLQARLKPSSEVTSFRSIPIINLTKSFSSSLADRQAVAAEIHKACTEVGFFCITGHGIPNTVCDEVLKLAQRFFHELPQSSKDAIHIKQSKYFRGYEPNAFSSVNNFTSKETKEAFNWGYESGLDPTGGDGKYVELDGVPESAVNLWPKSAELPGFYEGIADYYGRVRSPFQHLGLLANFEIDYSIVPAPVQALCPLLSPTRRIFRSADDTPWRNCSSAPLPTKHEPKTSLCC